MQDMNTSFGTNHSNNAVRPLESLLKLSTASRSVGRTEMTVMNQRNTLNMHLPVQRNLDSGSSAIFVVVLGCLAL